MFQLFADFFENHFVIKNKDKVQYFLINKKCFGICFLQILSKKKCKQHSFLYVYIQSKHGFLQKKIFFNKNEEKIQHFLKNKNALEFFFQIQSKKNVNILFYLFTYNQSTDFCRKAFFQ